MNEPRTPRISRRQLRRIVAVVGGLLALAGAGFGGYTIGTQSDTAPADATARRILEIHETPEGVLSATLDFIPEEPTPSMYDYPIPTTCDAALAALSEIVAANPPTDELRGPKPDDRGKYEQINLIAQNVCIFGTYRDYLITVLHPWQYGTAFVDRPAVSTNANPAATATPAPGADSGAADNTPPTSAPTTTTGAK